MVDGLHQCRYTILPHGAQEPRNVKQRPFPKSHSPTPYSQPCTVTVIPNNSSLQRTTSSCAVDFVVATKEVGVNVTPSQRNGVRESEDVDLGDKRDEITFFRDQRDLDELIGLMMVGGND